MLFITTEPLIWINLGVKPPNFMGTKSRQNLTDKNHASPNPWSGSEKPCSKWATKKKTALGYFPLNPGCLRTGSWNFMIYEIIPTYLGTNITLKQPRFFSFLNYSLTFRVHFAFFFGCLNSNCFSMLVWLSQWIFQVPVKGGRDYITP